MLRGVEILFEIDGGMFRGIQAQQLSRHRAVRRPVRTQTELKEDCNAMFRRVDEMRAGAAIDTYVHSTYMYVMK